MSCRDEGVQLACLKLVHALLRQLKADDVVTLLPTLASFVDSRSVACRAAIYDIFMWLSDNYGISAGSEPVYRFYSYALCLKKVLTLKLSITLSDLNRFSQFLHCWKAYEICYKTYMTLPTAP